MLGNAHLTNFFVNNENVSELELALKAYSQTERNLKEPNPDMFFNFGISGISLGDLADKLLDFLGGFG